LSYRRLVTMIAAATLALAGVGACSSDSSDDGARAAPSTASTTTIPVVGSARAFYAVPDPLPAGKPGQVIRLQEIDPGTTGAAHAYRVLYHSRSVQGADIAVSGLVLEPRGAAPTGGRKVLSYAHGTTGIADECAPSRAPRASEALGLAKPFLDGGYVVVATDYEGLGTPGRHPYVVGISEGRGVLDIVRAARNIQSLRAGSRFAVWGHSQGGHAALFAAQLAAQYAPELHLVGAVAGAPATELPLIAAALRNNPFQYYLAMAAAGFAAAYPNLDLHDVLTDKAIEILPVVDRGCSAEVAAAFQGLRYEELASADDPMTVEPWAEVIRASDPGHERIDAPLYVYHGGQDEQIPVVASELLAKRLCGLGQVIERRVFPGQSHAGVIGPAMPSITRWIADRFAGRSAPSTCDGGG
jgi:acetyl esterase/lipase